MITTENSCVCILTAGKGSRLNERTKYFNKALLRVGDQAVISHTINSFPENTTFVIALGYKGNIVQRYLEIAHPNRDFVEVCLRVIDRVFGKDLFKIGRSL